MHQYFFIHSLAVCCTGNWTHRDIRPSFHPGDSRQSSIWHSPIPTKSQVIGPDADCGTHPLKVNIPPCLFFTPTPTHTNMLKFVDHTAGTALCPKSYPRCSWHLPGHTLSQVPHSFCSCTDHFCLSCCSVPLAAWTPMSLPLCLDCCSDSAAGGQRGWTPEGERRGGKGGGDTGLLFHS